MHVVNEPGSEKVADDGGAAADAYVLVVCGLAGSLERLGGRGVDKVERRAALHLDRRAVMVGENENRCVNGGFGPQAPCQFGSSCHPGWPNFPAPMISAPIPGSCCRAKTSSTPPLPPGCPLSGEQPLVQPVSGVTEMCVVALTFTGAEAVERDGEVVDADE